MDRIPDNYDMYVQYENEVARWEKRLPVCACCKEPIRSEKAYDIDGWYCQDCFDDWVSDNSTLIENLMEDW